MKAHALTLLLVSSAVLVEAGSVPVRARNSMVVSQNAIASQVGVSMLMAEGNAMDAAVAAAFALAVVHPSAGNIGGEGSSSTARRGEEPRPTTSVSSPPPPQAPRCS